MALSAGPIKIEVRGTFLGQRCQIVQWFTFAPGAGLGNDPAQVGEAYWNHIKATFRALFPSSSQLTTNSLFVAEPGPTGAYGEYAVNSTEQFGTRPLGSLGGFYATFAAAGFRESVGTRTTRPGQKRLWGLFEGDVNDVMALSSDYTGLLNAFAAVLTAPATLGAPAALAVLTPIVARLDRASGLVLASQPVIGYITNPLVTSQVSRKIGHGS